MAIFLSTEGRLIVDSANAVTRLGNFRSSLAEAVNLPTHRSCSPNGTHRVRKSRLRREDDFCRGRQFNIHPLIAGEGLKNRWLDVHMHASERAAASARSPLTILYDRCARDDFD
jgi:hypothetical protein